MLTPSPANPPARAPWAKHRDILFIEIASDVTKPGLDSLTQRSPSVFLLLLTTHKTTGGSYAIDRYPTALWEALWAGGEGVEDSKSFVCALNLAQGEGKGG